MEAFNHYFIEIIKNKYSDFKGKATRREYWYFVLFYILISIVLSIIDIYIINSMLGMTFDEARRGGILQILFSLGMLVPSIALSVRRLHDIGKSGWMILIGLIPLIGGIILIYFFLQKSKGLVNFKSQSK